MALEQWEIDLRNQLNSVSLNKKSIVNEEATVENKVLESEKDTKNKDLVFYACMILFFFLAFAFILDFKTDFISKLLNVQTSRLIHVPQDKLERIESKAEDAAVSKDLVERTTDSEEKLFVLGIVLNENAVILKNGLSRKDMLTITKDWKLNKYPKYIKMSDRDKEYLDGIQSN